MGGCGTRLAAPGQCAEHARLAPVKKRNPPDSRQASPDWGGGPNGRAETPYLWDQTRPRSEPMDNDELLTNQRTILANQEKILSLIMTVEENQAKLNKLVTNQAAIVANQERILSNQAKLDKLMTNQVTIVANQEHIQTNQEKLDKVLSNQAVIVANQEHI
jgi:hypothetical protein